MGGEPELCSLTSRMFRLRKQESRRSEVSSSAEKVKVSLPIMLIAAHLPKLFRNASRVGKRFAHSTNSLTLLHLNNNSYFIVFQYTFTPYYAQTSREYAKMGALNQGAPTPPGTITWIGPACSTRKEYNEIILSCLVKAMVYYSLNCGFKGW